MAVSVLQLLQNRLSEGARKGEEGVLLDGFPRTRNQAEALLTFADVQLALNLSLREEVGRNLDCCTYSAYSKRRCILPTRPVYSMHACMIVCEVACQK